MWVYLSRSNIAKLEEEKIFTVSMYVIQNELDAFDPKQISMPFRTVFGSQCGKKRA